MAQVADYEITSTVLDDGVLPCLRARRPGRLGGPEGPVTVWVLGPLARSPWPMARSRLEAVAGVRSTYLPEWLEAGVGEWAQRPVVWVSASMPVTGTLAVASPDLAMPAQLRALARAARGAHALHEGGQLHGAICPQAVALVEGAVGEGKAVLAPPAPANGERPLVQIGYPPLSYVDPQLLRGEGGRWSDIWALGATAFHLVTGSSPFPGIEELPVVRALGQLLSAPGPVRAEVPGALSDLVGNCLSPDPESRPPTAEDVAQRLEEAAAKW